MEPVAVARLRKEPVPVTREAEAAVAEGLKDVVVKEHDRTKSLTSLSLRSESNCETQASHRGIMLLALTVLQTQFRYAGSLSLFCASQVRESATTALQTAVH